MKTDKVYFLGQEYEFPHELYEYVLYCRKFQSDREYLMSLLFDRVRSQTYDFPDTKVDVLFKAACQDVIRYLAEVQIYNVTEEDLLTRNTAYYNFLKLQKDAAFELDKIDKISEIEYQKEYVQALDTARGKITGSGYSLISNSVVAHMTFAAMESNTIKRQEEEAKRYLQQYSTYLQSKTELDKKQTEWTYVLDQVYPKYVDIIVDFFVQLIDCYLSILEDREVYAYSAIKKFSIDRSSSLLKNLDLVENKENVLIQAFQSCPYNVEIYQYLIDMNLLDDKTESTVEFYEQHDALISSIKEYLGNVFSSYIDPKEVNKARNNIKWLSKLEKSTNAQVEEECFGKIQGEIQNTIRDIFYVSSETNRIRIEDFDNSMHQKKFDSTEKYIDYLLGQCKANIYKNICGEEFFQRIFSRYDIKADSLDAFRDVMAQKINENIDIIKAEMVQEQEVADRKKKKKRVRNRIIVVAIVMVVVCIFAGKQVLNRKFYNKIETLCSEVSKTKFTLKPEVFTKSGWIEKASGVVRTGIVQPKGMGYLTWSWKNDVKVTVKEEFDNLNSVEQYWIIASIGKEAGNKMDTVIETQCPEFVKYFDYSSFSNDNWSYLKEVYGKGVSGEKDTYVYIVTSKNTYQYVSSNAHYYIKNGSSISV